VKLKLNVLQPDAADLNEFDLIRTFFTQQAISRDDVIVGIGDDAALVRIPADMEQAVSTDMLLAGCHFPSDADPVSIGYKSLAVNLSDLAAMGATPAWFTMNLSLPQADRIWLEGFCLGMFGLAMEHVIQLIGGDTVRGPLAIGMQVHGLVPRGQALLRTGAKPGDNIYITGELGDAGIGLMLSQGRLALPKEQATVALERFSRPQPRIHDGIALRGVANSCIDISDGLIADLEQLLVSSHVGAQVHLEDIPVSSVCRTHFKGMEGMELALTHGDDYELCFTVPLEKQEMLKQASSSSSCPFTCIGEIQSQPGLRIQDADGKPFETKKKGYDHFLP